MRLKDGFPLLCVCDILADSLSPLVDPIQKELRRSFANPTFDRVRLDKPRRRRREPERLINISDRTNEKPTGLVRR